MVKIDLVRKNGGVGGGDYGDYCDYGDQLIAIVPEFKFTIQRLEKV